MVVKMTESIAPTPNPTPKINWKDKIVGATILSGVIITFLAISAGTHYVSHWWNLQPDLTISSSVASSKLYTWLEYQADGQIIWFLPDGMEILSEKSGAILVGAKNPGKYTIQAAAHFRVTHSALRSIIVVLGSDSPNPDPIPIVDGLEESIKIAYGNEIDTNKVALANILSSLYSQGAILANDPTNVTWSDLFTKFSANFASASVSGKLPLVQKAVQTGGLAAMPNSANLTANIGVDRTIAVNYFNRVATLVGGKK